MAIPTVEEAINRASFLLGDTAQRRFKPAELVLAVGSAWEEMVSEMVRWGASAIELTTDYTLPAGTSTLLPATAGISNFGELVRIGERAPGSGQQFSWLEYAEVLPETSPVGNLIYYRWANERFTFSPAQADVQLRIVYLASGKAPDSGSLGIDDCLNVVAKLAAAIAAPTKGLTELGGALRVQVYKDPNHMQSLLQPMLRTQQLRAIQPVAYQTGGQPAKWRPPFVRV